MLGKLTEYMLDRGKVVCMWAASSILKETVEVLQSISGPLSHRKVETEDKCQGGAETGRDGHVDTNLCQLRSPQNHENVSQVPV